MWPPSQPNTARLRPAQPMTAWLLPSQASQATVAWPGHSQLASQPMYGIHSPRQPVKHTLDLPPAHHSPPSALSAHHTPTAPRLSHWQYRTLVITLATHHSPPRRLTAYLTPAAARLQLSQRNRTIQHELRIGPSNMNFVSDYPT